jgi:hypothetical protein
VVEAVVICDCIYDTSHMGRSPLVPIIRDFLLGKGASDGRRARRMCLVSYETRDEDIQSSFWRQINDIDDLSSTLLFECDVLPSEGNDQEKPKHLIFCIRRRDDLFKVEA